MESETATQTSSPSTSPAPADLTNALHQAPRFGRVIPNRIFVGGIDVKTNENDLRCFFSQYGTIKEVKIVIDRAGISKGYGFVTFEAQEDAQKILLDAERLCFRDKQLNIGQAIRKQQVGSHCMGSYSVASQSPSLVLPDPFGTTYLTTPTGCAYTYHDGVAYFHTTEPNPHTSHWPVTHAMSGSPVMMTQSSSSFCTPQPYHQCQVPSHYVSGHVPWTVPQVESPVPVSPSPLCYAQPPELMYQSMEMPAENECVQSTMPLVEATLPEVYVDHMVQPPYQICMQSPVILSHDGVKEQTFHQFRRGFPHSPVHMKPRYCRGPQCTHLRKNYHPELAHTSPPLSSGAQEVKK
ncbi:protein boule-like isoform X2 [Hoplias malabaricus]|uniref:protein boule-like isoform X2 n=1 Tax=Hoplias malabaricus TaxID=27720 RepID=UPI0034625E1B